MKTVHPPLAPKIPLVLKKHQDIRVDEYFWLRDIKNPKVLPHLKDENQYFKSQMKPIETLTRKLNKEMMARIEKNESTVPAPEGAYLYWSEYKARQEHPVHMRSLVGGQGKMVLLDENQLAKGLQGFSLSGYDICPMGRLMIYGVDTNGSEKYEFRIKNLVSGKLLKDRLQEVSGSVAWAADGQTLFYVKLDKNLRPYRVYRHRLGDDQTRDVLIFEEKNSEFFVHVNLSRTGDYLYIHSGAKDTDEIWYLSSRTPGDAWTCIQKRQKGLEYSVSDRFGEFWILTNKKGPNFCLMKTPIRNCSSKYWKLAWPHSKESLLESYIVFSNHVVLHEQHQGLPRFRVLNLLSGKNHVLKMDGQAYSISFGENREFYTQKLRFGYSSPIVPSAVIECDLASHEQVVLKQKKVRGHQPSRYVCERVMVKSHDGVKVPLTLVYKKGLRPNGKNPGYLYGYGSYGISMPDAFPSRRDVYRLIDRGFVYAVAHPRGGSEMGRAWYENGKYLKKKNTFFDFNACAKYLISKKWIAPKKLAACGGSAGGMLMGACMNMCPELYAVIAAHVPFVDVLNTMLDPNLPLTQLEYNEWGNPEKDPKYYRYIKSYSPYDNICAQVYPALFVTCGLHDPRVTYWEPAKWVARLREIKTDSNPILFKINMGAGHAGASGRYTHLRELAEEYAFILNQFGIRR